MRRIIRLTALLLSLLAAGPAWAAANVTADKPLPTGGASTQADQITPSKTAIAPHRAIYDMTLASVKNGSNVASVSGRMLFEWADECDGWAVQQHLKLHFNYAEGDESDVTSTEVTWESKDGKRYNFNIRRVTDGKETDNFRGNAALNDDGSGLVKYTSPEGKTAKLTAGTLFPTQHTELILQKALSGERFFTRRVFDGSDDPGSSDISVFIDPPQAHWLETEADPKLKENPLLDQPAWPVHMAFFKIDTETGEPDYEMDLSLLANGIAKSMRIDYGDFTVSGKLVAVEPIPAPHC